jgi:hypothetical protein
VDFELTAKQRLIAETVSARAFSERRDPVWRGR